jgi:hypothetical protein
MHSSQVSKNVFSAVARGFSVIKGGLLDTEAPHEVDGGGDWS